MAGSYKSIAAGNQQAWVGFLDSNGFLLGGNTTAPSTGATGSGMLRITGIKSAPVAIPEREVVQITGDDDLLGEIDFSSLNTRAFMIEVAVQDLTLEARLLNVPVETIAGGLMSYQDITTTAEYDTCLIFQSRSKKQDTGVRGKKAWSGMYIPLATVQPIGRNGFDERGAAVYRFMVTPQLSSKNAWGVTMLDGSSSEISARFRQFSFDYPIYLHRWTGTGAVSAFNTDVTPIDTSSLVVYSSTGASQAITSITTATKTVTLTSAPAANLGIVGMIQYQP